MSTDFAASMRQAGRLTRAAKLMEATRVIQNALKQRLGWGVRPTMPFAAQDQSSPELFASPPLSVSVAPTASVSIPILGIPQTTPVLARTGLPVFGLKKSNAPAIPDGAAFLERSFTCSAGTRGYKLYVPAFMGAPPRGLIVMLHGCKQDPDDFAAGTNMNAVAEAHGLLVAYPRQTASANVASCWNWFDPRDQMRDSGEPAVIAGITRSLMSEFALDREQVFVAGLSAGGAMAAVMAETYPDLYAAVGIHSGLAYQSANDAMSAFATMRGDFRSAGTANSDRALQVRTIVFQGSADHTVDPSNATRIVAAAGRHSTSARQEDHGRSAGGRSYTRTIIDGIGGAPLIESWLIDGAGHAWSGGSASGSYTDPKGPDASAEMVRFFMASPVAPRRAA